MERLCICICICISPQRRCIINKLNICDRAKGCGVKSKVLRGVNSKQTRNVLISRDFVFFGNFSSCLNSRYAPYLFFRFLLNAEDIFWSERPKITYLFTTKNGSIDWLNYELIYYEWTKNWNFPHHLNYRKGL